MMVAIFFEEAKMKRISVLTLALAALPLASIHGQQTKWEYGTLTVSSGGGVTSPRQWSAGDSTVSADSLMRRFSAQYKTGGPHKLEDALVYAMNEFGQQGWEFVELVPQYGLVFKRRKE
jgi:hypothetical protein